MIKVEDVIVIAEVEICEAILDPEGEARRVLAVRFNAGGKPGMLPFESPEAVLDFMLKLTKHKNIIWPDKISA